MPLQRDDRSLTGISRLLRALLNTFDGLAAAFRYEQAFRLEVLAVVVLAPVGVWLGSSDIERALLLGTLLLIPIVELLNSAVETAVDRIGEEHHELSGRAKDLGSAAVFLTLVLTGVVWALVLGSRWVG